ncbi:Endonuclease/exonuclease/phosphatase superfamily [Abeliophyllum distichum]|uniref:Endonuclease/exonuclease/phosphatase superfamily n=1 Tax=Abeliophyllum distichum TaxID=126358 RepID=A0ABD1RVL5_9LAMI
MPLRIDEATADLLRPSEARVCVEVNLEHKLPNRIWIDQSLLLLRHNKPIDVFKLLFLIGPERVKRMRLFLRLQGSVPVVGSSLAHSLVVIPPPIMPVGPTHQLPPIIPTVVASKPAQTAVYDPLLDYIMSVLRETSSFSVRVDPHGHFRMNSSDDLTGLDERHEADGFTTVQRKKNPKVTNITWSNRRRNLWIGLHQIFLSLDGPWIVGGDFNMIAHNGERTGRNTRDRSNLVFTDMIMDCSLTYVGYSGNEYTGQIRVRDTECRVDETELDHDRDLSPSHHDTRHQAQAFLNCTLSIEEGRHIRARIWSITLASGKVFEPYETIQPSTISFFEELLLAPHQPVDPNRPSIIPRLVFGEDNL